MSFKGERITFETRPKALDGDIVVDQSNLPPGRRELWGTKHWGKDVSLDGGGGFVPARENTSKSAVDDALAHNERRPDTPVEIEQLPPGSVFTSLAGIEFVVGPNGEAIPVDN